MRLTTVAKKHTKFKRLLSAIDNLAEFREKGDYALYMRTNFDYLPIMHNISGFFDGLRYITELDLEKDGSDIIMSEGIRTNSSMPPYLEFVDSDLVISDEHILNTYYVYIVKVLPTTIDIKMPVYRRKRVLCYNINKLPDNYDYDLVEKEIKPETVVTQNSNDVEILTDLRDRMLKMSFSVYKKTVDRNRAGISTNFDTYVKSLNILTSKKKDNSLFHNISGSNPGKYGSEFHAIKAEVGSVLDIKSILSAVSLSSNASIGLKSKGYKLHPAYMRDFKELGTTIKMNSVPDPDVTI